MIELATPVLVVCFVVALVVAAYSVWMLAVESIGAARAIALVIAIAFLSCFALSQAKADCRAFFKKQAVVVQQVAVPVAVYPPVYYAAGQDIQAEALAEKVARLVEQKLSIRQQQVSPAVSQGAFAKCIKCHSGPEAPAGLVLDGSPVSCHTYFRWGQIAGQGKEVPAKMQALVSSMTPEQKGAINEALLDLVVGVPGRPAEVMPPPKPPVPDGELQ